MTEKRMHEIAILLMRDHLSNRGIHPSTKDETLVRFATSYKRYATECLANLLRCVLEGKRYKNNNMDLTGEICYSWIKKIYIEETWYLNNNFRRGIGNKAKHLKISTVQLIQFYRLILIEIINEELQQTEEEVPLSTE